MLEKVSDEKSLLKFIEALISDRVRATAEKEKPSSPWGRDAGGWGNTLVDHFFESARWSADEFRTRPRSLIQQSWKRFAVFLLAGNIYE
jgi:SRSO17 transposase